MDGIRFDRFTRLFASAPSRRSILSMAASGITGSLLGFAEVEAKKGKKGKNGKKCKGKNKKKCKGKDNPKGEQCRISQSDEAVSASASFKQEDVTLTTVDTLPVDPREPLVRTMTIRQKQALLVESEFSFAPGGAVEVRITNGKGYRGFSEAVLTINAGMVSGSIDGRALVPFSATEAPASVQFQDGQPAPEISIGDKLQESITKLVDQAMTTRQTCEPATSRGKDTRSSPRNHDGNLACLGCKGRCLWDELVCGNGVRGACAPFNGVPFVGGALYWGCVGLALVGCVDRAVECLQNCRRNRDCCPVLCGTLPDWSCCHANEQCLTFGTGFGQCCAPGETACHEQNCCKPGETCMPGGTCCVNACGSRCCGPFDSCCGGQCCSGTCNGNTCCTGDELPCGDGCCNGTCCNGECCPRGRICCNGNCCPSGFDCQNGTCVQVCTPGQIPCAGRCCEGGRECYTCPNGARVCRFGPCIN
jgi:hypothetical protein